MNLSSSNEISDSLLDHVKELNHLRCHYCSQICANKESHLCHESRHIPTTIYYPCVMCYKKFSNSYSLRLHIQVKHLGISKYKCSYCHKTFRQKSHLIEHERIHTGERPFKCNLCLKGFATHSHLKVHTRSKHKNPLCSVPDLVFDEIPSHVESMNDFPTSLLPVTTVPINTINMELLPVLPQNHIYMDTEAANLTQ